MINIVPSMAKDPAKSRVEIHIQPELKEALKVLAKADKRSLLTYIEIVLEKHIAVTKKKSKN